MRSAKRRQEIIKRNFVRQILHLQRGSNTTRTLPVEQVIGANADVEEVPRFHSIWIVIRIFCSRLWKGQKRGSASPRTVHNGRCVCRRCPVAREPDGRLLRGAQGKSLVHVC